MLEDDKFACQLCTSYIIDDQRRRLTYVSLNLYIKRRQIWYMCVFEAKAMKVPCAFFHANCQINNGNIHTEEQTFI